MSMSAFMLKEQNSIDGIKTEICTIWPITEKFTNYCSLLSSHFTQLLKISGVPPYGRPVFLLYLCFLLLPML